MTLRRALAPIAVLAALLPAHPASAQQSDQPDPLDNAMVRLGPLGINPSITLHDLGRDENVFNDATNPKSDFTFTLSPKAEVLFRPRLVHLDYTTRTDYVYYQTYTSQRSTNEVSSLRADFDLARVQPFLTLEGVSSHERYSQEIDVRAHHHQTTYGIGSAFTVATRTSFTVGVRRSDLSFDPGASFRGQDLSTSLDGHLEALDAGMGVDLTPFTKATVTVSEEQQRFTFSHDHDANIFRISPTVAFSPQAVLKGSASVGYSRFSPLSSTVPGWSGVTGLVTLSTAFLARYQADGSFSRGVQYSYDPTTPYYVSTAVAGTLTVAVVGPFDVRATGSRQLMAYRQEGTANTPAGRAGNDTFMSYGAGFGYKVGDRVRVGVNADWSHRASELSFDRTYRNRRLYASMTWGAQ